MCEGGPPSIAHSTHQGEWKLPLSQQNLIGSREAIARRRANRGRVPPHLARTVFSVFFALTLALPAGAEDSFDRLEANWNALHGYSVTIDAHEVLGAQTADSELHYTFTKPSHAELDVLAGNKSGSTILWDGGDRVVAFKRNMSFFKMHGSVRDRELTSLRGNSIVSPNLGDLIACFGAHRDALREREGPVIDGQETDELVLPYSGISCPDDSPADHAVTLDELDISRKSGLIVMRKRFEGDTMVERWELKDYKLDAPEATAEQ